MKNSLRSSVAVSVFIAVLSAAFGQRAFTSQFSFGDSLSDNGNLYALTGRTQPPSPPLLIPQGTVDTSAIEY